MLLIQHYNSLKSSIVSLIFKDTLNGLGQSGVLIVVAHGFANNSLLLKNGVVHLSELGAIINSKGIKQVIAIFCDGNYLTKYVSSSTQVIGIYGLIDAVIGGLAINYFLSRSQNILYKMDIRDQLLTSGVAEFLPLDKNNQDGASYDWSGSNHQLRVTSAMYNYPNSVTKYYRKVIG